MKQPETSDGIELKAGDKIMVGVKNSRYGSFEYVLFKGKSGGYFYRHANGTVYPWPTSPHLYDIYKVDTVGTVA